MHTSKYLNMNLRVDLRYTYTSVWNAQSAKSQSTELVVDHRFSIRFPKRFPNRFSDRFPNRFSDRFPSPVAMATDL